MILGNNKKRKRGEIDIEEMDEASKKKLRRMEERQNMLADSDSEELDFKEREMARVQA